MTVITEINDASQLYDLKSMEVSAHFELVEEPDGKFSTRPSWKLVLEDHQGQQLSRGGSLERSADVDAATKRALVELVTIMPKEILERLFG